MASPRWTKSQLEIKLSSQGLLSSINSESTGQAGEVVKGLVKLASTILPLVSPAAAARPGGASWPNAVPCVPLTGLTTEQSTWLIEHYFKPLPPNGFEPLESKLPESRVSKLFIQRDKHGCEYWQKGLVASFDAETARNDLRRLEAQVAKTPVASLDSLLRRIEAQKAAVLRSEEALRAAGSLFKAKEATFAKGLGLKSDTKTEKVDLRLDLAELPPATLIPPGTTYTTATGALNTPQYVLSKALLDKTGHVVTAGGLSVQSSSTSNNCATAKKKTARIYYRQAQPILLTTLRLDKNKTLKIIDQKIEEVIDNVSPPRCVEVVASGFGVRKFNMTFDAMGRPVSFGRTAESAAAAATAAFADAATTARDEYVKSITALVTIDEKERALKLSELEDQLATLKKEKEVLDADLTFQGAVANQDLTLQQQQLDVQLKLLKAQIEFEQTSGGKELQLEIAQLTLQITQLTKQVELLQAQLALSQGRKK